MAVITSRLDQRLDIPRGLVDNEEILLFDDRWVGLVDPLELSDYEQNQEPEEDFLFHSIESGHENKESDTEAAHSSIHM